MGEGGEDYGDYGVGGREARRRGDEVVCVIGRVRGECV